MSPLDGVAAGADQPHFRPPAQRLVVLGASNVQISLPTLLGTARTLAGGPVDFFSALGHGRSFGRPSSIPGRTLPAITTCRLWDDLADSPRMPTASLVTDIGNDLLYGRTPQRVAEWVAVCADRLAKYGPVALAGLPLDNLATLGEWRYRVFRTVFFPGLRISLKEIAERAQELSERLNEVASERGYALVEQPPEWYGIDPIHYKLGKRGGAWRALLSEAMLCDASDPQQIAKTLRTKWLESARVWLGAPDERRLLGFQRRAKQPCLVLNDGSRVALY